MLTSKIRLTNTKYETPEDIFWSALGLIFPDEICNQHGDDSTNVIYDSVKNGEILLSLAVPKNEDTLLFSHYVWNAAVQLAILMDTSTDELLGNLQWNVQGQNVLELGAGTGLAGIIAHLTGAKYTVITDYPAPEILSNIQANVTRNIISRISSVSDKRPDVTVQGHQWGQLNDSFSLIHQGHFTRVLVCDCLWMPCQHENIRKSISWFLEARGFCWIVAGFHTGKDTIVDFFEENSLRQAGLVSVKIWERDVDGLEREWLVDRKMPLNERKRWLVIAVLRKVTIGLKSIIESQSLYPMQKK